MFKVGRNIKGDEMKKAIQRIADITKLFKERGELWKLKKCTQYFILFKKESKRIQARNGQEIDRWKSRGD